VEVEKLLTEQRNPVSMNLDTCSTIEMVELINSEDQKVARAIATQAHEIAQAIDQVSERFNQGGRLIYCGAGTSGRLGILDAVELVPTYGIDPKRAIGLIAGGQNAVYRSVEGAEDSAELAKKDLQHLNLNEYDSVFSLAASGRTPYAIGALEAAKQVGALAIAVACVADSRMSKYADVTIAPLVGPEVVTGSTRMKAGSAQKMVLNTISTGVMVRAGKVYQNLMVNVLPTNEKLMNRAIHIIAQTTNCDLKTAQQMLINAERNVPAAIIMQRTKLSLPVSKKLLKENNYKVADALNSFRK
jgi:N-acetylmuramic acid 6-phosphate etherase